MAGGGMRRGGVGKERKGGRRPVEGSTMMKKASWQTCISRLHFGTQCILIQQQQPFELSPEASAIFDQAEHLISMLLKATSGHVLYYYNGIIPQILLCELLISLDEKQILSRRSSWMHHVSSLFSLGRYSFRQPFKCKMADAAGIR